MRTWVRRSLNAGALTAGALLVAGSAAQAAPIMASTDNTGVLNGTQALLPVQAPIDLCGNAVAAAGNAFAACTGGSAATLDPEWSFHHYRAESGPALVSTGNVGIGNGTQVFAPIQAPVDVCGNAVSVLGFGAAACQGGATAEAGQQPESPRQKDKSYPKQPGYQKDTGKDNSKGAKDGGKGKPIVAKPGYGYQPGGQYPESGSVDPTLISSGNTGILNGTQLFAPIQLPINICGNAIAILGTANASCDGGATATQRW